jgi:hypothetical protein
MGDSQVWLEPNPGGQESGTRLNARAPGGRLATDPGASSDGEPEVAYRRMPI